MKDSALVMLLGKKPPPGKGEAGGGSDPGSDKEKTDEAEGSHEELEVAAGDLISALKDGNAKRVASAFEAMNSICKSYGD